METPWEVIGHLKTPYPDKFGVPRQSGLVKEAEGLLVPKGDFAKPEAWRGIEGFSHLWILFLFHRDQGRGGADRLSVRPPRLGGEEKMGVFATRSGFRPNGIGMSLLELIEVKFESDKVQLRLGGVDCVDETPVIDVKPYLPWADAKVEASAGFAGAAPRGDRKVKMEATIADDLHRLGIFELVRATLALDPRPAWQRKKGGSFGTRIASVDLRWRIEDDIVFVDSLRHVEEIES